jgi:hypothetical protein
MHQRVGILARVEPADATVRTPADTRQFDQPQLRTGGVRDRPAALDPMDLMVGRQRAGDLEGAHIVADAAEVLGVDEDALRHGQVSLGWSWPAYLPPPAGHCIRRIVRIEIG